MKAYSDLTATVKEENSERRRLKNERIGTQRIDVQYVEQLRFEASFGSFSFVVDEPRERGGTDGGLPPLAHFLAGAASCLMTQYAKLALEKNARIDSMKAVVRGHFDRRLEGAFTDIIYDIEIKSPNNSEEIGAIAREAESMCYAHNTLKKSVRMNTNLVLNGRRV
jgi:uncharacterized OsmC-like protein